MGLLSKANLLETPESSNGLAFSNLIKNNNLSNLILFQKNKDYFIINSVGTDCKTILQSVSTIDYWNGICPNVNTVYNFSKSDNSIAPLLQLFSSDITEKLSKLSLIKLPNENIFLIYNSQISEDLKKELSLYDVNQLENTLSSLQQKENYVQFSLDYSELKTAYPDFQTSIINEIYNRLLCFYFKDIYISKENDSLNFAINKNECNNSSVLIKHILANLTEVLENNINLIKIKAE